MTMTMSMSNYTYMYTHIHFIFKIHSNIMSFRKLGLARVFTLKLNRVKSSEAVIYWQQKSKFKSRQTAHVFRTDFFLLCYPRSNILLIRWHNIITEPFEMVKLLTSLKLIQI